MIIYTEPSIFATIAAIMIVVYFYLKDRKAEKEFVKQQQFKADYEDCKHELIQFENAVEKFIQTREPSTIPMRASTLRFIVKHNIFSEVYIKQFKQALFDNPNETSFNVEVCYHYHPTT